MNKLSLFIFLIVASSFAPAMADVSAITQGGTEGVTETSPTPDQDSTAEELFRKGTRRIGSMRPSFYWISIEPNDGAPRTKILYNTQGHAIAKVSADYFKKLLMEGTGRLRDGRVVNYKDGGQLPNGRHARRWQVCGTEAPYGYGARNMPLIPFRSAAVDPRFIPLGSLLYIPAVRGIPLPDGTVHDGFFRAIDVGDMIQKRKIDIFTSFGDQSPVFESRGIETGKDIDVYLVGRLTE